MTGPAVVDGSFRQEATMGVVVQAAQEGLQEAAAQAQAMGEREKRLHQWRLRLQRRRSRTAARPAAMPAAAKGTSTTGRSRRRDEVALRAAALAVAADADHEAALWDGRCDPICWIGSGHMAWVSWRTPTPDKQHVGQLRLGSAHIRSNFPLAGHRAGQGRSSLIGIPHGAVAHFPDTSRSGGCAGRGRACGIACGLLWLRRSSRGCRVGGRAGVRGTCRVRMSAIRSLIERLGPRIRGLREAASDRGGRLRQGVLGEACVDSRRRLCGLGRRTVRDRPDGFGMAPVFSNMCF